MRVGVDIGYSGVKLAFGTGVAPAIRRLSVGAAPANTCVMDLSGKDWPGGGHRVLIDRQPWVAGIDPIHLSDFERRMDESYPASDEYLALYYAALSSVPSNHIELLVTGLPVKQFRDPVQRDALRTRLIGRHYVREDLVVDVDDVMVVPQPAGAFRAHARQNQRLPASDQIRPDDTCLIVDPGHFSLDWVIFSGGFHADSSGSTLSAGQVIVSRAAAQLTRDHGVRIPEARLERAIMAGRRTMQVASQEIDIWSAIEEVAEAIVQSNLKALRGTIRTVNDRYGVDVVLLAGGGATLFEKAVRNVFDSSRVIVTQDPVMANAKGFYDYAYSASPQAQQSAA